MAFGKAPEQHIAVFGESGSGKTVLLSSFYGATQEPEYIKNNQLNVVAESSSQGARLMQNYLGMKRSASLPPANHFQATSYSFLVKVKEQPGAAAQGKESPSALRLVWHDYPGEWFHDDVSGPTEAQRRVDAFRSLLSSDVALLLVDGQKLSDHAGEEARYLKSLFTNVKNSLLLLKDDLLPEGKPLVKFPRIWILALSKADLLPEMDVYGFRDVLLESTGADIAELRDVIGGFVESDDALSVGEDFVLFSSAKFGDGRIEVTQRIGLDLILPLAAMLPFMRHLRWAEAGKVGRKVAMDLLSGAEILTEVLGAVGSFAALLAGSKSRVLGIAGLALSRIGPGLSETARLAGDKLKTADATAASKKSSMAGTMVRFREALDQSEEERILLRSQL